MFLAHKALKPKGWRFNHLHVSRRGLVIEFRGPVMVEYFGTIRVAVYR
jgi:hypothetical protein